MRIFILVLTTFLTSYLWFYKPQKYQTAYITDYNVLSSYQYKLKPMIGKVYIGDFNKDKIVYSKNQTYLFLGNKVYLITDDFITRTKNSM